MSPEGRGVGDVEEVVGMVGGGCRAVRMDFQAGFKADLAILV